MTPKERAAMQQALGALVRAEAMYGQPNADIQAALREALEQSVNQEPVAWMNKINGFICKEKTRSYHVPLYTAPQPVKEVELTDDEIEWLVIDTLETWNSKDTMKDFARAVIAADREKNK